MTNIDPILGKLIKFFSGHFPTLSIVLIIISLVFLIAFLRPGLQLVQWCGLQWGGGRRGSSPARGSRSTVAAAAVSQGTDPALCSSSSELQSCPHSPARSAASPLPALHTPHLTLGLLGLLAGAEAADAARTGCPARTHYR